jgi:hypothetical protein
MLWDYIEVNNIFGKSRSYSEMLKDIMINIELLSRMIPGHVSSISATNLPYESNYFDAVITDRHITIMSVLVSLRFLLRMAQKEV